ncbi:hypothetical protein [uncultured Shewanella sp.]|uniref:hypothetical protein n=1 Tax=uncultured Shewanella sp. TaxID=173975 RepID=UPI0026214882|nr:hypothetical protein [uncultured Shewanella sp.]
MYEKDYQARFTLIEVLHLSVTSIGGTSFIIYGIYLSSKRCYNLHLDNILFGLLIFSSVGIIRIIEYPLYLTVKDWVGLEAFNYIKVTP